jgi:hypothetical protein
VVLSIYQYFVVEMQTNKSTSIQTCPFAQFQVDRTKLKKEIRKRRLGLAQLRSSLLPGLAGGAGVSHVAKFIVPYWGIKSTMA